VFVHEEDEVATVHVGLHAPALYCHQGRPDAADREQEQGHQDYRPDAGEDVLEEKGDSIVGLGGPLDRRLGLVGFELAIVVDARFRTRRRLGPGRSSALGISTEGWLPFVKLAVVGLSFVKLAVVGLSFVKLAVAGPGVAARRAIAVGTGFVVRRRIAIVVVVAIVIALVGGIRGGIDRGIGVLVVTVVGHRARFCESRQSTF
jgi:hypothetical protein